MNRPMTVQYDRKKYDIYKLPHPLMLHWIINPGLAINEIFLGQRIPKLMLIDKTASGTLQERQFVPCPHCGTLHRGMLWARSNSFGHWLGYICPECKGKIPCLWNLTSLLILAISFPIWVPIKYKFEKQYIAYELRRLANTESATTGAVKKSSWMLMGFVFGSIMFVLFLFQRGTAKRELIFSGLSGIALGVIFSTIMWFFFQRRSKT